jgi:stearoyl-CoA desaturase (delta-9 desaturase)
MTRPSGDSISAQPESETIQWATAIPFFLVHLMSLWAFQTGISIELVVLALASYYLRMLAITAGVSPLLFPSLL